MGTVDDGELPQCELGETTLGQYVHSPYAAIETVLAHCGVDANAVVVDLGCGDGRACLIAAQRFRARGIGVDIDAELVDRFVSKARTLGLHTGLVDGLCGDACAAATLPGLRGIIPTHVYLYILAAMVHLLIPALQHFFDVNPNVVIISAFDLPPPNVPVDRCDVGVFTYKIYKGSRPL